MLPHLDPMEHPHSHEGGSVKAWAAGGELGQAFGAGSPTHA